MKRLPGLLDRIDRSKAWLPLLLRLAVGATFILAGWPKMKNYSETVEHMSKMDMPLAKVLSPLVPITEFVGGILLVAGLGTRIAAFLLSWVMVFAIFFVHWKQGFKGWEWQALLLASCLTLMLGGPGVVSIDHAIRSRMGPEPKR